MDCVKLKNRIDAESDPDILNAFKFQYQANCVQVSLPLRISLAARLSGLRSTGRKFEQLW